MGKVVDSVVGQSALFRAISTVWAREDVRQQLLKLGILGLQLTQPLASEASMPPSLERHL
jgi:hypothetical protein